MSPAAHNVPAPRPVPVPSESVAELPQRPGHAQARAHAREAEPAGGVRFRLSARAVPAVFSGSSLWHSQPPSLAMIWDKHAMSARYFDGWAFRYPRLWWGYLHIGLAAFAYLIAWVTHSIPLLLLTAGVLALVIWLA